MNIDNYFHNKMHEFGEENVNRLISLYEPVPNKSLKKIFSKIHFQLNYFFKYLNERLSNGHYTEYFVSREHTSR